MNGLKALATLLVCIVALAASACASKPRKVLVFVGAYTSGESEGISVLELDTASGALTPVSVTTDVRNPSFLALDPGGRFLYAVSEVGDFEGQPTGGVVAFAIDRESGSLRRINARPSGGAGPCHLVVDQTGANVLVANYGGGSVAVLRVGPSGELVDTSAFVQHEGSSVNKRRQNAPHAHSINLDPSNRFAYAADLGIDRVLVYRFDPASGLLDPTPADGAVAPGAGPRHLAFHPSGRWAYVINELHSTVTAFERDAADGTLRELQTISTLPDGFEGNNSTAEIRVHPSGRFLYGSNRGHDSIAVFAIDPARGTLTPVEHEPTQGRTPRNFNIDPTGSFVLAANQRTDSIVVFRIDPTSGALEPTGHQVRVPTPVCVRFLVP